MVVIFTSLNDPSANLVMDYLKYKHAVSVKRIFNINNEKISIEIGKKKGVLVNFCDKIHGVWIYKGFHFEIDGYKTSNNNIISFLKDEIKEFRKNLLFSLSFSNINIIGKNPYEYIDVSKIRTLMVALKVGLNIPETHYAFNSSDFHNSIKKIGKIVIKPLTNIAFFNTPDNRQYSMYTKVVEYSDKLPFELNCSFPSLVQEYIKPSIELRVFFIKDHYFTGAVFKELNTEGIENFDYRASSNIRIVPFLLPKPFKNKLKKMTDMLGLNTGSIDIIVSDDGNYYLLEVNPVGQFRYLSHECNFDIEEKISDILYDLK